MQEGKGDITTNLAGEILGSTPLVVYSADLENETKKIFSIARYICFPNRKEMMADNISIKEETCTSTNSKLTENDNRRILAQTARS